MLTFTLTSEQQAILLDLLENAVNEIHTEILHTDNHEYREDLKDRKHKLVELAGILREAQLEASLS